MQMQTTTIQGNMNGGEVDMLVDQLPIVEPNNNGNQVQPPEEIFVGNDNHQAPAEEEAVTSGFPSRNTLKRDVMRMYFDERAKIQRFIYVPAPHTADRLARFLVDYPAIGNNIVELEGCFTALDIISGSDDEPIDIEDQGFAKMRTQRAASCCLSNEMP
ncbi:hypothetical protein LINPERHAP2_LOCUS5617 [Linum perenne]